MDGNMSENINSMTNDEIPEELIYDMVSKKNQTYVNGYLLVVVGCMFSGKTSYIIRECNKWRSIGKKVLMINYEDDKRYSNENKVISHDQYGIECKMMKKLDDSLNDTIAKYDVILINEGQFFPDLKRFVKYWTDTMKKIVVVSGLDGDYLRSNFKENSEIVELIPDCDDVIKLKAYCSECRDGTEAIFTWKIIDNSLIPNTEKGMIDIGVDKYVPLCRKHYNEARIEYTP